MPIHFEDIEQKIGNQSTNYNTTGKPNVKTVQHCSLVVRIKCNREWIACCFDHSVSNSNADRANKQHRRILGEQVDNHTSNMTDKCKYKQTFHSKHIA